MAHQVVAAATVMPAPPRTPPLIPERAEWVPGCALSADTLALLLIAHPDPGGRDQPGQRFVEDVLRANHLATLSFSLRTPGETAAGAASSGATESRRRVLEVLGSVEQPAGAGRRPVALLGMDGAVPACIAAAAGRGASALDSLLLLDGRPQRSQRHLARLRLPTLFLVGAGDARTLAGHRKAVAATCAPHRLEVLTQPTRPDAALGAYEAIACAVSAWIAWTLARRQVGPIGPLGSVRPLRQGATDRTRRRTASPAGPSGTSASL